MGLGITAGHLRPAVLLFSGLLQPCVALVIPGRFLSSFEVMELPLDYGFKFADIGGCWAAGIPAPASRAGKALP